MHPDPSDPLPCRRCGREPVWDPALDVDPASFGRLTMRDLARLFHQAEDTEDDILLLQVDDEMHRRERAVPGSTRVCMEHYYDLIRERLALAKGAASS